MLLFALRVVLWVLIEIHIALFSMKLSFCVLDKTYLMSNKTLIVITNRYQVVAITFDEGSRVNDLERMQKY